MREGQRVMPFSFVYKTQENLSFIKMKLVGK